MNERIIELAEHAWKKVLSETNIDGDTSNVYSPDEIVAFEQKFAELIVKECAQFVEDKFDFCGDEIVVKEMMLEHFGVEL